MSKTVLIPFALPVILLSAVVSPALPIDRYVATTGSDTADGSELAPFATISHAVTVLAADADIQTGTSVGVVHVAAGTYTETGFDDSGIGSYATGPTTVSITLPIHVVGATGDPADVIVTRGSQNNNTARIFALNHADALLKFITVRNGRINTRDQFGGNIAIGSAGGTVENCTIVDCSTGVADRFGVKCNGGTVLNTAAFHVVGADDGRSCLGGGNAAGFVNCASDDAAVPNASCVRMSSADFHDYAAGNYEPTLNGSLHNAGSSDPAYVANYAATDLAGNPRVFGTRPIDIGCYEYCKLDGTFFMLR